MAAPYIMIVQIIFSGTLGSLTTFRVILKKKSTAYADARGVACVAHCITSHE